MAQARGLHRVAEGRTHRTGVADRQAGQQGSAVTGETGCRLPEVPPHRGRRGQQRGRGARPLGVAAQEHQERDILTRVCRLQRPGHPQQAADPGAADGVVAQFAE
jgi:hypothetical protein